MTREDAYPHAREEIEQLLYDCAWADDQNEVEKVISLFTEDATWELSDPGGAIVGPYIGHAAITRFMAATFAQRREQRRHIITNVVITARDESVAVVRSYVTLLAITSAGVRVETSGWYEDEVRRQEKWRLRRRRVRLDRPYQ